jgi:uncharacterized glyoxalase superfamily protein PhnB
VTTTTCSCCARTGEPTVQLHSHREIQICYNCLDWLNARRENDDLERTGSLYIHCDDANELADEWRKAGLDVTGPKDEEYGKREGSHTDPDGNLIRFGSPTPIVG